MKVFYSYSHKDEKFRETLEEHLSLLRRQEIISEWHDRRISAGREWAGRIDEHLKTADIILLLISSSFLASNYCYDVELTLAIERYKGGESRVIPVILRPCDWTKASFSALQALPKNGRPVTKWPNRDDAFTDVANGIREVAEELVTERQKVAETPEDAQAEAASAGVGRRAASLIPRPPVVGFVARRDEQGRDIVELLGQELSHDKSQLVALWGPGGSGKTTLAAEFVRATADAFKGRVAWVSALGRADFGLVILLDEIATRLGREDLRKLAPEPKVAKVTALVSDTPTLIILDNFETISGEEQTSCLDFLVQSAACPALITTRYGINRDDVYNVPLAAMTIEEARDFLGRLVKRTRKPSNFDRLDRDDLIRRCEATPLVLQWVVRQIDLAKRPQDVLNDLARGVGDAAERVFTRSFNLPQLGDDGRAALLALSLFTPDASREALSDVAGFGDDLHRLGNALENLSALWFVETTEGNERLLLRGLTRELVMSRLSKDARAEEFRCRYLAFFLRHSIAHTKPSQEDLDALKVEKENLFRAMDMAFGRQAWESVMQIRESLNYFLVLHGYWDEALKTGAQAVAAAGEVNDESQMAYFKTCIALIRNDRGDYKEAERIYRESLEVFRRLNIKGNIALCLHQLGITMHRQGVFEEARQLYGESLEIKRKLGNERNIASTMHQLGRLAQDQNELEEARRFYDESLKINQKISSLRDIAASLNQIGNVAYSQGQLQEARRLYEESLLISRKLGQQLEIAATLCNLGELVDEEGDKTEAVRLLREALGIFERLCSPHAETVRRTLLKVEVESA
jgi:tetratricopeptide (TPR) repeat protein